MNINCFVPLTRDVVNIVMSKHATSVREQNGKENVDVGTKIVQPSATCRQLLEPARAQVRAIGMPHDGQLPVPALDLGAALKAFPNADTLDLNGSVARAVRFALDTVKDPEDQERIKTLRIGGVLDGATLSEVSATFPALTDLDASFVSDKAHRSGGPFWFETLTRLQHLDISHTPCITRCNLEALKELKGLRCCTNNPMTADVVAMLKGKANLETLSMDCRNNALDADLIFALTQLTRLDLYGAGRFTASVDKLSTMRGLESLRLYGSNIRDISPVSTLGGLTELDVGCNKITDATPLAALTNLRRLNVSGNKITDATPLAALTNLTSLNVSNNEIADVTPLAALTCLMA